jgi:hypothetical protein
MFGFGSVPLTSYFGAPEGGSQNTMFSPTARAMLQQGENYQYQQEAIQRQRQAEEEAYQRQQQQQEAERVASQAFSGAPQMTDEQITQQFVQNPAYLQTKQGQNALGYLQFRQSVTPAADKVLAPQMLKKIEDPRHRAAFQERIQSGVSANDAYDAYRKDTFNEKHALDLAAVGIPEEDYGNLRDEKGLFKPDAVARRINQAKADVKSRESVADQEIGVLGDALSKRMKMLKDMGKEPAVIAADPLVNTYTSRLESAQAEKLNTLSLKRAAEAAKFAKERPSEAAPAKGAIGPDGITARAVNPTGFNPTGGAQVAPVEDLTQAPEHRAIAKSQAEKQAEANKAQAAIDREVASAWTEKKKELQADIEKAYSQKDLLGIASAIYRGDQIPLEMADPSKIVTDELGQTTLPAYEGYVLQKLKRAGTAFKEPQNNRWGTQDVSQGELLRAWAEQYVREHSSGQSGQAGKPMARSGSPTSYVPPAGDTTVPILPR